MSYFNPKLSAVKQDVTTEIYKCYHICQFCMQWHYHWRGKFFVGACQAINYLTPNQRMILVRKGFPKKLLRYVAGRCPDCRYRKKMATQFSNQSRPISQNIRNLRGPGTNWV